MQKMAVQPDGLFDKSVPVDVTDPGGRKVYAIARPGDNYGPGFAVLPIRPDPGSQSDTCFLINTENLFIPNPWTGADWDAFDVAGAPGPDQVQPPSEASVNPSWPEEAIPFLVAGPHGKVFLVDLQKRSVEEVPSLRTETPVWSQLREGLIVGTTTYRNEVMPIFNLTSVNAARRGSK
jgi:hypothetical protein